MFTKIRNGQIAKRSFIYQNNKKFCESFLKILWDEGFILGYKVEKKEKKSYLKIFLKYILSNKPSISVIKIVTKPGRRITYSVKQIWKMDSSKTTLIFSTNKGLKTIDSCKKLKLGGEPFILIN